MLSAMEKRKPKRGWSRVGNGWGWGWFAVLDKLVREGLSFYSYLREVRGET